MTQKRKTKFVDIPVHPDTRDKLRTKKKKKNVKSFDKLLNDMIKFDDDILSQELI